MPLQLPDPTDQEKVEYAIANPDSARISYLLDIGGEPWGHEISSEDGEWGTDDSGVNYCDLVLNAPLPRELEGESVRFSLVIDGVIIPQLVGIDSLSEIGEDRASTDPFQARSAGGLANENTLDETVECSGWTPEQVVRKAASFLPYERGGVRVDPVGEPILYFSRANEGTHFNPEQHPSDIFSAVQEKAPYLFTDTYVGGLHASVSVALGKGAVPARTYDADVMRGSGQGEAGSGWRAPPRIEPRYGRVVVFRREPNGVDYAFWAEANINYRGYSSPPKKNRTYYVELEDPTGDGPRRAQQLAHELAGRFLKGVHADEIIIPSTDPLLMRGDPFRVEETAKEGAKTFQRAWLCWAKSIKKETSTVLPTVGYEAMLFEEEEMKVPSLVLAGVSGGITRPPYGIQGEELYFEDLPWVSVDGDELVFYEGGPVSVEGDELVVTE